LEKYIDLDGISNDELYETFNRIGLEVDSLKEYKIPDNIVVGRIVACSKHPDADKLSLCQIDIGASEPRQIICGAANVVDAEYVAVATVGAILPDGMEIKPAKLRGIESDGMVCSSEELGLPKINDGIMILDDSVGGLKAGREISEYPKIADTVIELELTANRGDCLSIHGVARDLSAAFDRPLKTAPANKPRSTNIGIARKLEVRADKDVSADLTYLLANGGGLRDRLAILLRLAFVDLEIRGRLENIVRYSSHATGVILHAYDAQKLQDANGKIKLEIIQKDNGQVLVTHDTQIISTVGASHNREYTADDSAKEILFEASYIDPVLLVEAVSTAKLKTDPIYYNTSRGSEPDLAEGVAYLQNICGCAGECFFYEGSELVRARRDIRTVAASVQTINAIIGDDISKTTIFTILQRLGFDVHGGGDDAFGIHIPPHRHDIVNLHDITEEILRMVGIDNIDAKPLTFIEQNRLTDTTRLYRQKRDMRQRASAAGFYEAVTYAFADRSKLKKYGFEVLDESMEIANPIVEELNTLRSTLLTNLLEAAKRNVSYGIRKIPLFEIGTVFDAKRNERNKISFVWSGYTEAESVVNHGKPDTIDFASFVKSITAATGKLDLLECKESNGLMHPYQSALILKNNQKIGYITKLHPAAARDYGLGDTYVAEMDLEPLLPENILAHQISNYQGVYKDISVLVDQDIPYADLAHAVSSVELPLLKKSYVIDVYEDSSLGESKSVTIRLFLQSDKGTLADGEIEDSVKSILTVLEDRCQAQLR
jgi:phenylalanyl-tRNA synthetase beta chain